MHQIAGSHVSPPLIKYETISQSIETFEARGATNIQCFYPHIFLRIAFDRLPPLWGAIYASNPFLTTYLANRTRVPPYRAIGLVQHRRPSAADTTANVVFGQSTTNIQPFVAHRFAPFREKPLDTTNRVVEESSEAYIITPGESQFKHICIAFDRPYDRASNTGGTLWICHLQYEYPKYGIQVGLDKEVMGQIQTLPAPFGSPVVRKISDMYIWEEVKYAALNVLGGLAAEGRRGDLSSMFGPLKTALDLIPTDVGVNPAL